MRRIQRHALRPVRRRKLLRPTIQPVPPRLMLSRQLCRALPHRLRHPLVDPGLCRGIALRQPRLDAVNVPKLMIDGRELRLELARPNAIDLPCKAMNFPEAVDYDMHALVA